jgi:Calcineurin-like phosphoesterase
MLGWEAGAWLRCAALVLAIAGGACSHSRPFMVAPLRGDPPPSGAVDHRLLLIGDAGDPDPDGEPTLHALRKQVELMPTRTTVVFLGDNVYETGMPEPSPIEGTATEEVLDEALLNLFASRRDSERRVKAQVKAVDVAGARTVFIPGNHDWDQFGVGGWQRVRQLEDYLRQLARLISARVTLLPGGGCPGPITVDLGRHARLVVLDTQWFLEAGKKPTPESNPTGCAQTTEDEVLAGLRATLDEAARDERSAIVVGHHPLRSHGPHGGYVSPRVHLFPFVMFGTYVPTIARWIPIPVLGTIMGEGRAWFSPNPQDMSSPPNEHMREKLLAAMSEAEADGAAPLMYASGHEHSLQVFRNGRGPRYLLVSGLGSHRKALPVGRDRDSLFVHSNADTPGFAKVDFLHDGRVRLAIVEATPQSPDGVEVWANLLETARPGDRRRHVSGASPEDHG